MSKHTLCLALLPNETLSEICERLYPQVIVIKMLRLVERQMHDLRSPYLMEEAFFFGRETRDTR